MPRTCTICAHDQRAEIELAATNGATLRHIAQQHQVDYSAISRHMTNHVKQATREHMQRKEEAKTLDVLGQLVELNEGTWAIWRACKSTKKTYGMALSAADRIVKQLELAAKLQGDLDQGMHVDITLHPEFSVLQSKILSALDTCPPDVRLRLVEALSPLEEFRAHLN